MFDHQLASILAAGFEVTFRFCTNSTTKKKPIMEDFTAANPELSPVCAHTGDAHLSFFLFN